MAAVAHGRGRLGGTSMESRRDCHLADLAERKTGYEQK